MSNEVVKSERTNAVVEMSSSGALMPRNFEGLWRIATIMSASGFMPKGMDKVESVFVAVQLGLEVGLAPMQAVQSIASINNRPCIWGDAMLGLVERSNLMEFMKEFFENESTEYPPDMAAVCTVRRKNGREVTQKFSVADAKRAGLWTKPGPWTQFPRRMLQMRARGFALRDLFPDVLKGLKMAEEVMDYIELAPAKNGVFQAVQPPETIEDRTELYTPTAKIENGPAPQPVEKPVPEKIDVPQNGGKTEPAPVLVEDSQSRTDNHFRQKWINLRKPGFADYVHKNPGDFKLVSESVRLEARTKWSEFYPDVKFPACIAPKENEQKTEPEPPPEPEPAQEEVANFNETPEYQEYFQACEIDPGMAKDARSRVFGQDREPASAGELTAVLKVFNQLLDEKNGPGF